VKIFLILPNLQPGVKRQPVRREQPFQRFILTSQHPSIDAISQTVKTVAETRTVAH